MMKDKMKCDFCAMATICRFKNTAISQNGEGCSLDVAVPHCNRCEFCEKYVEEVTGEEYFFCTINQNKPVGKMGFCSYGELKQQLVSQEKCLYSSVLASDRHRRHIAVQRCQSRCTD